MLFNFSAELRNVYADNHFYLRIAEFLKITGEENPFHGLNLLFQGYHSPKPYHYSEIWSVIIANTLSPLSLLKSLFLVVTPFYIFLTLIGFLAYFQNQLHKQTLFKIITIVFIGLNCAGIYFFFYDHFSFISTFEGINNQLLNDKSPAKYLLVYPLLMAFILIRTQSQKFALFALIAISSFTFFPAVLGAIGLELLFLILIKRNINAIKGLFLPILICFSIILFYYYSKNESGITLVGLNLPSISKILIDIFTNTSSFLGIIKNMLGTTLRHGIFFGLFFIYNLIFNREIVISLTKGINGRLLIFVLMAGTLSLAIFRDSINSLQLVYNISMPFFAITTAILMLSSMLNFIQNRTFLPLILGFLLFMPTLAKQISNIAARPVIVQNTDYTYIKEVSQWCNEQKTAILLGGSLKNKLVDYPSRYDKGVVVFTLGSYLAEYINKPFLAISLNDLSIPLSKDSINRQKDLAYISQGALYNFAQEVAELNLNEGQIIVKFIKEKGLRFIIVRKGVNLPKEVSVMVDRKITDSKSGEQFFILKNR